MEPSAFAPADQNIDQCADERSPISKIHVSLDFSLLNETSRSKGRYGPPCCEHLEDIEGFSARSSGCHKASMITIVCPTLTKTRVETVGGGGSPRMKAEMPMSLIRGAVSLKETMRFGHNWDRACASACEAVPNGSSAMALWPQWRNDPMKTKSLQVLLKGPVCAAVLALTNKAGPTMRAN